MTTGAAGRRVVIEVVEILAGGTCPAELEVGDRWVVESGLVPAGFCGSAYHTLFPYLTTLRFGGSFPWEDEEGYATIACPDAMNPVVFRMHAELPLS